MAMNVKEAIARAKEYVRDVFSEESIDELDLEETEYREGQWRITVSFSRARLPPASPRPDALEILTFAQGRGRKRTFKVVFIRDEDGTIVAMRDRAWMERVE